ncbi:hypothetical protein G9A89_023726 [Geosiphon pyriformis]|nr:hypothetical protein G9A89_023726 [Geosiphon pyriformis]
MGNYLYLSQQSKKYFEAHNKNNLDFIELNFLSSCLICFPIEDQFSRQFQDFWNWFLNKHSAEIYTPPDSEYLNHQIHIWIAAHQATKTSFKTEEESYQTASVFDLLSSKSDSSTQTVTSEPMANNPMQANILAALQDIQTALGRRNNTPLPLFRNDFKRAATANQYDKEYKWTPTNAREKNTSFIIRFETKFRTPILISKWHMELERRIQDPGEVITEYAKAIRKLIKCVDSGRNWTEKQKIYFFTKGLRTNLSYALWPFLALKDNSTMDMAIELTQKIEDNQKMHLRSTLLVFAPALAMAPAPQIAAVSFAAQIQDPNEQLIDRLTANFVWLLEPLA